MADTWMYHKDHKAKVVDSNECEALEAEGWRDHQNKADNIVPVKVEAPPLASKKDITKPPKNNKDKR